MHDPCCLAGGDILAAGLAGDRYTGHQRGHDQLCHRFGIEHGKSAHGHNGGSRAGNDAADIAHDVIAEARDLFRIAQQVQSLGSTGDLLAAMAWKGFSSADITATPMISNTMPSATISKSTRNASTSPAPSSTVEEKNEIVEEITTATKKTVTIHRI